MDVGHHPTRLATATLAALLLLLGVGVRSDSLAASTSQPASPGMSWQGSGNPYVWTMGDSITASCNLDTPAGGGMGIGWRDLGHIAWPGATTHQAVERLQGIGSWPASTVTEESVDRERVWFRDAGAWIIEFGTNDARTRTPDQYREDVRWFLDRSNGRPVVWVNSQDPDWKHPGSQVPATIDALNAVLTEEAMSHSNLKVVDWNRFLVTHRQDVRGDGVHPADGDACRDLFDLVRAAVPGVPGDDAPRGFWYGAATTADGVNLNGWAASWVNPRRGTVSVNVRRNGQQVGRFPVVAASAGDDWYANAASGRFWGAVIPSGGEVCVDLVDAEEQWTSLGCRAVP